MNLQDLKHKSPAELLEFAEEPADRERQHPAPAGHDVRDPEAAGGERHRHPRRRRARSAAGRVRLPALARGQLPARPRRHLCQPEPGAALRPADRRHGRRPDPRAQGRRALFRPAQGQQDQFRRAGEDPPPDQLRQPDAALSRRAAEARERGSDPQGHHQPRHRPDRAAGQGPARADRRAAAHRQDRDAAEPGALDLRQPSGMLPDRAADRRAAGGSHRHVALGEGRGDLLDLRRAGLAPRAGDRDGAGEGQAPGRAQARRGDPAGLRSPASPAPTTPWCHHRARC